MILRRYGSNYQSVQPNFDSRAMTEIGFMRTSDLSVPTEEFGERYQRVDERALTATAQGDVKDEAEQELLASLLQQLEELEREAGEDQILVIESEAGKDYPKTRDKTTTRAVEGDTRLYFEWTIDPPLRVGIYRRTG